MADPSTCLPLTPDSITAAHAIIAPYIHRTPLLASKTLNEIASSPNPAAYLSDTPPTPTPNSTTTTTNGASTPQFSLHFKSEHLQRIGAFKARGAFHALTHLISIHTLPEIRRCGVTTHSSGNHAQALALAAHTFDVPSYIVMPRISTESKIQGTKRYATEVVFSGSTSQEREEVVRGVVKERGSVVVPPYDHVDVVLGQGTVGRECWEQFREGQREGQGEGRKEELDLIVAPIGGGGLLGGIATWFSDKKTKVVGGEPSFEGADDARRGLEKGERIEVVKSLTIADGLRTPVGKLNWGIVSDKSKVEAVYSVSEEEIKMAMRLVWERMKCVVEPSGCVALAVVLFNKAFREWVASQQKEGEPWDVAVVFSGGNTTMKAVSALFGEGEKSTVEEREEGKVGSDGRRVAENVAG